ncbi:M3 family metallopeptidase [Carboxylicivirga sp. M1479]|uniref:M3 family metallopeptidase n=1 Tax=Carboxylicivirga sp. M1479 TaxID=2594476 RepID=UPI0011784E51|nr:M3 family metallopeptidase [Carboxylicivirga sp. M1479]TRX70271.1 M3 family metallopeptidase [Carboxylicivirga sp. M1479]
MKQLFCGLLAIIVLASSCQTKSTESMNPFFSEYNTPYQTPPFELIKVEHYMPAFEKGMKEQEQEIESIVKNKEAANFNNTILSYDRSGKLLNKVSSVFFNIQSADNSDQIQAIARDVTPLLTKHSDNISMNMQLFSRVKSVYDQMEALGLTASQKRVTEKYYNDFVRNGAELQGADQELLKKYNEELSMLQLKFSENQLAETNKNFQLVVDNESDLAGLPDGVIAGAAEVASANGLEGKWVFTLQKPSLIPFLQYADNRDLREKIYKGYFMRGNNGNEFDNKEIARKMAMIRSERVKLLGFETHADYAIDVNMAKTADNVNDFLLKLWNPALKVAKQELKEMQSIIDREGGNFELQSWDWWYYAEKLRKDKYDLDESEITPYFQLENVRDGMFWVAKELYGISFTKVNNVQLYHTDVEVFEVNEADGKYIGLLYLDYHPRSSKSPGAWQTSFRNALTIDGEKVAPLVSVVCNFTKPAGDMPALLNFDEVSTLFHEFGHALHALFTNGEYKRTAGVVPQDYVELPSQIMENWAAEPDVMRNYARHYKTGEVIPDVLIEKLQRSGHFNQGFVTVEYLAASLLDLKWHGLTAGEVINDTEAFEAEAMTDIGLIKEIIPRYRTTYFSHIFSSDYYAAGYYVYIWAAVLDSDAFEAFKQSGDIFNKDLAQKFRQHCLSECGDDEGMVQYGKFRGQEPSLEPLLNKRGLN